MTFSHFDIEEHTGPAGCVYDYVEVSPIHSVTEDKQQFLSFCVPLSSSSDNQTEVWAGSVARIYQLKSDLVRIE